MLPDFRFLIGAVLATGMLGVAGFGLATAVRLSHEARVGPPDASQSLAFNDRADWNQFSDPELARRFELLARRADEADAAAANDAVVANAPPAAASTPAAPPPDASPPLAETPQHDQPAAVATPDTSIRAAVVEPKVPDVEPPPSPATERSESAREPAALADLPAPAAVLRKPMTRPHRSSLHNRRRPSPPTLPSLPRRHKRPARPLLLPQPHPKPLRPKSSRKPSRLQPHRQPPTLLMRRCPSRSRWRRPLSKFPRSRRRPSVSPARRRQRRMRKPRGLR